MFMLVGEFCLDLRFKDELLKNQVLQIKTRWWCI
jgi:hypothetical protein